MHLRKKRQGWYNDFVCCLICHIISLYMRASSNKGTPNHPSHGGPWLSTEKQWWLGVPSFLILEISIYIYIHTYCLYYIYINQFDWFHPYFQDWAWMTTWRIQYLEELLNPGSEYIPMTFSCFDPKPLILVPELVPGFCFCKKGPVLPESYG